jgi:nitrite reductase/ring-hydroxylating ferredoxin subunit
MEPLEPTLVELGDLSGLTDSQIRVFPFVSEKGLTGPGLSEHALREHGLGEHDLAGHGGLSQHGLLVCRVAGELHAVVDNCSHRDAKLSEGRLRGTLLTCPLHGAQFDVRTGLHQGPPASLPIACYKMSEVDGIATVEIA